MASGEPDDPNALAKNPVMVAGFLLALEAEGAAVAGSRRLERPLNPSLALLAARVGALRDRDLWTLETVDWRPCFGGLLALWGARAFLCRV